LRALVKKGRSSSVTAQAALDAIEREGTELVLHASRDERRVYEEAMKVIPPIPASTPRKSSLPPYSRKPIRREGGPAPGAVSFPQAQCCIEPSSFLNASIITERLRRQLS
jgi:hypothetical protein